MYAVLNSGGKQYKVQQGEVLRVEKISGDVGSPVIFDRILMFADGDNVSIGQPVLDGVSVEGHIVEQGKAKKIIVFKYKRRKRFRRKNGHRQEFTAVQIDSIEAKGSTAKKAGEPESEVKVEAKQPEAKVEAKQPEAKVEAKQPEAKAEVKQPEVKVEAKQPEAKVEAKQPEAKAEDKQPEVKVEAKQPEAKVEAKQPEAKAEAKQPEAKKSAPKKETAKKSDAEKAAGPKEDAE
jgi:large subunit ribosomal protein L21